MKRVLILSVFVIILIITASVVVLFSLDDEDKPGLNETENINNETENINNETENKTDSSNLRLILKPLSEEGQLLWMHPNNKGWKALKENKPEEWDTTLENIDGFGIFIGDLYNSDQETVTNALKILKDRGIRLQVEAGGLRQNACTGKEMAKIERVAFEKVQKAGIEAFVVLMDSPFDYTHKDAYWNNLCNHNNEELAYEMAQYMKAIKEEFSHVDFYWKESLGFYAVGSLKPNGEVNTGNLETLIPFVFNEVEKYGVSISGFSADNDLLVVTNNQWGEGWEKLLAVQRIVQDEGKRFSILLNYRGDKCPDCINGGYATNEEFYKATLAYYDCFVSQGGMVDDIYPESWWQHPDSVTPEEEDYTFANLMLGFMDRLNDQTYSPTCDFVNNVIIAEKWGTKTVRNPNPSQR